MKRLKLNGDAVDLQIWDFGGEDRFRFILPAYCRGASGAIFIYDITSPASLYHVDEWSAVLRSQGGEFPIIMAGTKADLTHNRKVQLEEAIEVANRCGITDAVEVSSKTGQNVDVLFESICSQMMKTIQAGNTHSSPRPVTPIILFV